MDAPVRTGWRAHCVRLLVDGGEYDAASGFDIPEVTEIGFAGGLTPVFHDDGRGCSGRV